MIDTSSLDKVWEYIEQLEQWWKQARKRVIELVDEVNELKIENRKLKSDLEWYKEHYWPKPLTTIEEVQNCKWNTIWM